MLESIWNDTYLKAIHRRTTHRQADTINRNAAFVNGKISMTYHLTIALVVECKLIAPILVLPH